ncbi:diacylglycerol/polyprenol kinase family protein [Turneriella parva]|uniref:Phosphatidate cytidylyltransferase n=1 Tax=Turneriella parva (strain ATCC BAA-1111 / DSM 21527 / NCTC 11395 / H) TaxID=869212 RepID=I4B5X9_TURPD|nr:phosphatidate cytidylyltransferase [Turneriella parva]AFM12686.1 phosphatidate cytidylyltransferase [Turneriella parva DSM 21527]
MPAEQKKLFSKDNQAGDKFNYARKLFHLIGLVIPVGYFFTWLDPVSPWQFKETTRSLIFWITGVITIFFLVIEFLRFRFKLWQDLFVKVAGPMLKGKELNKMHGSVPYILALCLVVGFFPRDIAILSILFLTFGDPAAALVGGKYGTIRFYNGKSLQGTLGGIGGAFFSGLVFLLLLSATGVASDFVLWDTHGVRLENWLTLCIGAISALLIEFVSHEGLLDDNLTIPVGASLIMIGAHALFAGQNLAAYFNPIQDLLRTIH